MPPFGPSSRRELVRTLRALGPGGPSASARHQFMVGGQLRRRIPNPHDGTIGRDLLARILRQAGISREEWERVE